jgi:hypothetical protein
MRDKMMRMRMIMMRITRKSRMRTMDDKHNDGNNNTTIKIKTDAG